MYHVFVFFKLSHDLTCLRHLFPKFISFHKTGVRAVVRLEYVMSM